MPHPAFANLEARLAAVTVARLANIALAAGTARYTAVLDRAVERLGEYGQFIESRDQITFNTMTAPDLAVGLVLQADPEQYSFDELRAMPRTTWTLDALQSNDGHLAVWWTR